MKNRADNAIMAKVRTLYGRRLTGEDYAKLAQSKSVGDVAEYLKRETYYAGDLSEVRSELVHRGQLETLVRRRTLNTYLSLLKYSYDDTLFLTTYIMQNEIRQLLLAIRLLNTGEMDQYLIALPVYLSRYTSFDLFSLAKARTFDDILESTRHSRYSETLARFRPATTRQRVNVPACEQALLTCYYRTLREQVERGYTGKTREDLIRLLGFQADVHNITAIYRLKRFFGYSPDRIREVLLDVPGTIRPAALAAMTDAENLDQFFKVFRSIPLARRVGLSLEESDPLSCQLDRLIGQLCQKTFRFSNRPVVVVISYMTLLELEEQNIIRIIEGARYQVPAPEIQRLLAL